MYVFFWKTVYLFVCAGRRFWQIVKTLLKPALLLVLLMDFRKKPARTYIYPWIASCIYKIFIYFFLFLFHAICMSCEMYTGRPVDRQTARQTDRQTDKRIQLKVNLLMMWAETIIFESFLCSMGMR